MRLLTAILTLATVNVSLADAQSQAQEPDYVSFGFRTVRGVVAFSADTTVLVWPAGLATLYLRISPDSLADTLAHRIADGLYVDSIEIAVPEVAGREISPPDRLRHMGRLSVNSEPFLECVAVLRGTRIEKAVPLWVAPSDTAAHRRGYFKEHAHISPVFYLHFADSIGIKAALHCLRSIDGITDVKALHEEYELD